MSSTRTPNYYLIKQKQFLGSSKQINKITREKLIKNSENNERRFTEYKKEKAEKESALIKNLLYEIENELLDEGSRNQADTSYVEQKENSRIFYPGYQISSAEINKNLGKVKSGNREWLLLSCQPPSIVWHNHHWREITQVSYEVLKDNFLRVKNDNEFQGEFNDMVFETSPNFDSSSLYQQSLEQRLPKTINIHAEGKRIDPLKNKYFKLPGRIYLNRVNLHSIIMIQKYVRAFLCRKKYFEKKKFVKLMIEAERNEKENIENTDLEIMERNFYDYKEEEIKEDFLAKAYKIPTRQKIQENMLYPLLKKYLITEQKYEDLLLFETEVATAIKKKKSKKSKKAVNLLESRKQANQQKLVSRDNLSSYFAPKKFPKNTPPLPSSVEPILVRSYLLNKKKKIDDTIQKKNTSSSEYTVGEEAFDSYSEASMNKKNEVKEELKESSESFPQSYASDASYNYKQPISLRQESIPKLDLENLKSDSEHIKSDSELVKSKELFQEDDEIAIISSYDDSDYKKFDSYTSITQAKISDLAMANKIGDLESSAKVNKGNNLTKNEKVINEANNDENKVYQKIDVDNSEETKKDFKKPTKKEKANKEVNTDPYNEAEEPDNNKNPLNHYIPTPQKEIDFKMLARQKIKNAKLNKELDALFEALLNKNHRSQLEKFRSEDIEINKTINFPMDIWRGRISEQFKTNKMQENIIYTDIYQNSSKKFNSETLAQIFSPNLQGQGDIQATLDSLERQQEHTYLLMMHLYEKILQGEDLTKELDFVRNNIEELNQTLSTLKMAQSEIKEDETLEKEYISIKRPKVLKYIQAQDSNTQLENVDKNIVLKQPLSHAIKGSGEKGILKVQKSSPIQAKTNAFSGKDLKRNQLTHPHFNEEIIESKYSSSESSSNQKAGKKNEPEEDEYSQIFESSGSLPNTNLEGARLISQESEIIEEVFEKNSSSRSGNSSVDQEVAYEENASSVSWTENL